MRLGGNFRCRRATRANSPNRLVCNQNTGELLRGQRAGAACELAGEDLFRKASVTVLLGFSQANDGSEAAFQSDQGFLGDVVVRLAKLRRACGQKLRL